MSCSRIFSLREFALCLVILANAVELGFVILTTSVSASPALTSVRKVCSLYNEAAFVIYAAGQKKAGLSLASPLPHQCPYSNSNASRAMDTTGGVHSKGERLSLKSSWLSRNARGVQDPA